MGVDANNGLVHSLTETTAKCHDSSQRENLLHGEERIIGRNKAYADDKFKKKSITASYQIRGQK